MEEFTYTPFGFDESSENSYFREALGGMGTPALDLISLPRPLGNKLGEEGYFETVSTTIGGRGKFNDFKPERAWQVDYVSYQEPAQAASEDEGPIPESYGLSPLGLSEDSLSSSSTAATPDLAYSDDSQEGPGNEVEEDDRANLIEEGEALSQIITRKRKTRASSTIHAPVWFGEVKEGTKNHMKTATIIDAGPASGKKKRGRQPKLHNTKAGKDAAHAAFLERNRLAAHKCREKKRVGTAKQQNELIDVVNLNADLRSELGKLLTETHDLIQSLIEHIGQPCAGDQSQAGLENAQETLWTAEGTLLEMSLLRQQVGILVTPGEIPLDPIQPTHHVSPLNENGSEDTRWDGS